MHLGQLLDIVKTEDRAEAQLFLPALFANLDPARIPSSADMDTVPIPEHCLLDAKRAAMSLEAVNAIEIDHAASPDLWDRPWPWFSFLHVHYSAVERRALTVICEFLVFLQNTDGQKLQSVVTETPGFFLTLAVAWTALLQAPEGNMVSRAFDGINVFFNRGGPWSPSNLEELAEGPFGASPPTCVCRRAVTTQILALFEEYLDILLTGLRNNIPSILNIFAEWDRIVFPHSDVHAGKSKFSRVNGAGKSDGHSHAMAAMRAEKRDAEGGDDDHIPGDNSQSQAGSSSGTVATNADDDEEDEVDK
ncbi:hypothetical protein C8J57DRAFT_1539249 [Mycena rebaudengoi]|nr:hypothetical protein C8J57DRAFT_1539249 [Mycena rebaudengoi]